MLNGKFIAVESYNSGEWFAEGKVYEFVDGLVNFDDGYKSAWEYKSLKEFERANHQFRGVLEPYVGEPTQPNQPTRTVNVTKTNGDSVQMKFSYKDSEETVEYTVEGDGDLGDIMVMLREVTTFMTHLGFSEEVVLRKMKQYVEDSEI